MSGQNKTVDPFAGDGDKGGDKAGANAAAVAAAKAAGAAEGRAEGVKAERERFSAVIGAEAYAGREALAQKMLSETDMSAEMILGMLSAAPAAQKNVGQENAGQKNAGQIGAADAAARKLAALDGERQPEIGAGGGDETAAAIAMILGHKPKG